MPLSRSESATVLLDAPTTPIEHVADSCCPPYRTTLCGQAIKPDDPMRADAIEDCVVCASMAAAGAPCTNCGADCW